MTFLGPIWLINQIDVIALILAAALLVIFSDGVNKFVVFPLADNVRERSHKSIKKVAKHPYARNLASYGSKTLGTMIFLLYCWLGSYILAEYIFAPILVRLKDILIVVVLALFVVISIVINNKKLRTKLMKF